MDKIPLIVTVRQSYENKSLGIYQGKLYEINQLLLPYLWFSTPHNGRGYFSLWSDWAYWLGRINQALEYPSWTVGVEVI